MNKKQRLILNKQLRAKRSRVKLFGTKNTPRLSLFRSASHIAAQLIDDEKGVTLVAVHDREVKLPKAKAGTARKTLLAYEAGKLLAEKAKAKKIVKAVFDRGSSKYHGRIAKFAEGARENGLTI